MFFIVVVFVLGWLVLDRWTEGNARSELTAWAAREGYEIVSKRREFWGGPFWWRGMRNAVVYEVVVRDHTGRTRTGHVCCRPNILFGSPATVVWEERERPPAG